MPTTINRDALEERKAGLPPRLQRFMDNFFLTCEPFDLEDNYRNYVSDIDLYGATAKAYRTHRRRLLDAFYEITGTDSRAM